VDKRLGFLETIRITRCVLREREVFLKTFAFTAPVPAYQVIEAIERRWGREVQDKLDFYIESVIPEQ
jgi:hypothetical protein